MKNYVKSNSKTIKKYAERFPRGHWSLLKPGSEKMWYGTYSDRPDGSWDRIAERKMLNFSESGHPIFRGSSVFKRGELKSKEGGKKSIDSNDSTEFLALLLRTVISVNQLSIYGAPADMYHELSVDLKSYGRNPKHQVIWITWRSLLVLPLQKLKPMKSDRKTCCRNTSKDSNTCQKTRSYPNYASELVWDYSRLDKTSILLLHQEEKRSNLYVENFSLPRDEKGTRMKRWIQSNVRFGTVLDVKVCNHDGRYRIEVQVQSLFQDQTVSWVRTVNGVDKFVSEAMPTQEEEIASVKPIAKARRRPKSSATGIQTLFLLEKETGLTSKHRVQTILNLFKCRRLLLDNHDTVKKFLEELTEQSIVTTLLENAGRMNSAMLRIGQLKNGYQFWRKVEEKRKGFNIAWIRTFLINSCIFEQSKDIQEVLLILHCKTMYWGFTEYIYHVGNANELRSIVNNGLIPGGTSLKKVQASCILHCCESDA